MDTPVYSKLKNDLIRTITSRKLLPGQLIPSENTLAKKYAISRSSVRNALSELEAERKIIKKPGKGTIVNDFLEDLEHPPFKQKTIGIDLSEPLLFGGGGTWYYGELVAGAKAACTELSCRLCLVAENDLDCMHDIGVDGLILMRYGLWPQEKILMFVERNIPIVAINSFIELDKIGYIAVDDLIESFRAVEYLIKLGHERIGLIGGLQGGAMIRRRKGYLSALRTYGLAVREELIFSREPHDGYYEELKAFIRNSGVTALFLCNGHYCHFYALPAILEIGLDVPGDLSLICFDDIEGHGVHYSPAITCVKMPLREMGNNAVHHLVNNKGERISRTVDAELVIRKSCRELNPRKIVKAE